VGSGFKTFTAGSVLTASDVQNYLQDQAVMVFGGTAARSSAIGTANFEEGMLTYLTDVDKLQVYTGSSFQDVYPPAATSQGMTLINTTSFSGVSSQSFNNVFSSTYDNYKVLITTDCNSDTDFAIRFRVGGSDNSTASSYILQRTSGASTTVSSIRQTNNYFAGINVFNADINALDFTLYRPFLTKPTLLTGQTQYGLNSAINVSFAGQHNQSTSYDGFTFYGATFTGTISIYGFNK
jgi:hypothetical protein